MFPLSLARILQYNTGMIKFKFMKYLLILVAAISLAACKDLDIQKVEYHTTTMMGKTVLSVTADSVTTSFNGRGKPTHEGRTTKSSEWLEVAESINGIEMEGISDLEAPSNKRETDAAAHAKFVVQIGGTTYTSGAFDAGHPHEKLMPLMDAISKIIEENKR